ncbi:MAG: 3-phosphoshikimate 1-carboxyvinyltransferase [Solirubrobacterales bacterium]
MRARIEPGGTVQGLALVPGDKSIAHRWLILAATGRGRSELREVPPALDVRSTARCLAALTPSARDVLEGWCVSPAALGHTDGFTFNKSEPRLGSVALPIDGRGRAGLQVPAFDLDCGNSGTTMRLLTGVLASSSFTSVLTGDESLLARPMERVVEPLRRMGAELTSTQGRPPLVVEGRDLHGIRFAAPVPSAQVKGAVLLAGLEAEGETTVVETAPTRDHTERALAHLGAPIVHHGAEVSISAFAHQGFAARVPGDASSAAFLIAAAALTGGELTLEGVGLNPTRTRFLEVMERMGVTARAEVRGTELGEPVGDLHVLAGGALRGTTVVAEELPLVIDEVPVLAVLAAHAVGESWFRGASELRVKESDRLGGLAELVRSLGGQAAVEGDDLVVAGGGLEGGSADARGDHRIAMALCIAALAARSPVEVEGVEVAEVSFPGFLQTLRGLGARIGG